MKIIEQDPWLRPYETVIESRLRYARKREASLTGGLSGGLSDFANGHLYYGLHADGDAWVIREYAPNATALYLIGDFSRHQRQPQYRFSVVDRSAGDWELRVPRHLLPHGTRYRLLLEWPGGEGERIPAWCRRVVQDADSYLFYAQVWQPDEPYRMQHERPLPDDAPLLIYECHIGMSSEQAKIATYEEFRTDVLPRIARSGYNAIQLMAVQEHPYYASYGYHVSSFFAPSSRFGTPEDLKRLIDDAHGLGLRVIMDLVHAHAVRNEVEGLGCYDGTRSLFFHDGDRGIHPAWDSYCFDYGKDSVLHFLLSNCKYWLTEYGFDGFRFDGVTSMLYYSRGLGETFDSYERYFDGGQDVDAIAYLILANRLIHTLCPAAITIAEEVSGMPGIALPTADGGYGFDYRLAMNIPDYWIRLVADHRDEDWQPADIWHQLTNRRASEPAISYAESHDQALVGDKTLIFRMIDSAMYDHMNKESTEQSVDRGIALIKMIRLVTAATMNGGYLNFMGNEFGHPEWIDFPREGNGWSFHYARRLWSLADSPFLRYAGLQSFDRDMIGLIRSVPSFHRLPLREYWLHGNDQVLCFGRDSLFFVFNFHPVRSHADYAIPLPPGRYEVLMSSDARRYEGYGRVDERVAHHTCRAASAVGGASPQELLKLYLPARTALVLRRIV
ncbi:alpha amylase C-terminal domain-containing protein [Porphyromonas loveana]|uniref:alpha amylase C-terminal domain-containing protein n=1 Tax=Porphyromonas loveana TaxID=1884669 RepID=UPI0035A19269